MFGPPEDVDGECNAKLYLGDDYGDNHCTIRCGLPVGHDGDHEEAFNRGEDARVFLQWQRDEREDCEFHGLQSDDYCKTCSDMDSQLFLMFDGLRAASAESSE